MNTQTKELKAIAEEYKYLYKTGQISRDDAKLKIMPYIVKFNEKSIEIAKKYGMKPKKISFVTFIR